MLRRVLQFGSLLSLIAFVGCGYGAPTLIPVTGTVTNGDAIATDGMVAFEPDAEKGIPGQITATALIEPDGKYILYTTAKEGAIPGWYKVIVNIEAPAVPGADPYDPTPSKVRAEYTSPETTPLSIEVKEGGDFNIVLEPKDGVEAN
ncbi:MAG: hypothetical protein COA78_18320 [Blastopirellula sp.]|nr:MAG: hypothetical protein COA78_18320 [Blastopirellula sp.]